MRIPKIIPPEELPNSVEVRTFSGDLRTVYRPEIDPNNAMPGSCVAAILAFIAGSIVVGGIAVTGQAPFDSALVKALARWLYGYRWGCGGLFDCGLQIVLMAYTISYAVIAGFWLAWQYRLMRYAATVEDETT